ncbi:Phosphoribosylformylglycinamidine cyclo-ligase [uncultured archaeon]|nr:Phosphoribosylformylglycinamidine cyclo-ligase [uncultured archaeon]
MKEEQYMLDIKEKDKMSQLLAELASETQSFNFFGKKTSFPYLDCVIPGKNGINAIHVPSNSLCVVYSQGGDSKEKDLVKYSQSVVKNIINAGNSIQSEIVGIANVIDASSTDEGLVRVVGESLRDAAKHYRVPILNGELANLGKRVNCECNITSTGIGFISRNSQFLKKVPGSFSYYDEKSEKENCFGVFDPKGKPVIINSDGIGTKTEFYERFEKYSEGVIDFFAMNLDDCIKLGATPQVISGLIEYSGNVPVEDIINRANSKAKELGIVSIMQDENVGDRIKGYFSPFNISGSVVSTIDVRRLASLPSPRPGDSLISIRGKPNPRSNGITVKRELMERLFGRHWNNLDEGKIFGKYLAEPSTIFYPVFKELFDAGLATSVYHMSGGAFNGKLAKPIARHGLYVEIGKNSNEELFDPDWREVLMASYCSSIESCYEKWPMGNEGFVTTSLPGSAIAMICEHDLEAKVVGKLEKRSDGKTGIKLKAFNGKEIIFNGLG